VTNVSRQESITLSMHYIRHRAVAFMKRPHLKIMPDQSHYITNSQRLIFDSHYAPRNVLVSGSGRRPNCCRTVSCSNHSIWFSPKGHTTGSCCLYSNFDLSKPPDIGRRTTATCLLATSANSISRTPKCIAFKTIKGVQRQETWLCRLLRLQWATSVG
jgi:hypothetical protein